MKRLLLSCTAGVFFACGDSPAGRSGGDDDGPVTCSPAVDIATVGGVTNTKEVAIELDVSSCAVDAVFVRRVADDLYHPATDLGAGAFRRWVVLHAGDNELEVVVEADGEDVTAGSVSFDYVPVAPTPTEASGHVAGSVSDATSEAPIAGAIVYVRGAPGEVQTGADGGFTIPTPDAGTFVVNVEAAGFTGAQRRLAVTTGDTYRADPVYLVARDPQSARITPEAGGTLTNSAGDVEIRVPPAAVRRGVDISAVSFPSGRALPGALPEASRWTQALEMFPDGVRFDRSATVRARNELGFAPGTEVPVGYYNRDRAAWEPMAMGRVSDDGQWIETTTEHFSAIDLNFPVVAIAPPGSGDQPDEDCANGTSGASLVGDLGGELSLRLPFAARLRRDAHRQLRLAYDSTRAGGTASLVFPVGVGQMEGLERVEVSAAFAGVPYQVATDVSVPSDVYLVGLRMVPRDASGVPLATGVYPLQLHIKGYAPTTYMTAAVFGGPGVVDTGVQTREPIAFDNRRTIPFLYVDESDAAIGAGWRFEEEERIYYSASMQLAVWERAAGRSTIHMGAADDLVADAAGIDAARDLVDFFVLGDDSIVLVGEQEVFVADSLDQLAGAQQVHAVAPGIHSAALAGHGIVVFDDDGGLQWLGLDGSSASRFDLAMALRESSAPGLPPLVLPGVYGALAVDRDGVVYVDVTGFGLVAVRDLRGTPEVAPLGIIDIPGSNRDVGSLAYDARQHALYLYLPLASLVQRLDLYTGILDSFAATGSALRLPPMFTFTGEIFIAPDGSLYYTHAGEFGRIKPDKLVARLESASYNHIVDYGCELGQVRFLADETPVVRCVDDDQSSFYALSNDRARDLSTGGMLTRTGIGGFRLEAPGSTRLFDPSGRLLSRTEDGISEVFTYTDGRLATYYDGWGGTVTFSYSGGVLVGIDDGSGGTCATVVDGAGDLTSLSDAAGRTTTFGYDGDHRVVNRSVDGRTIAYTWSDSGGVSTAALPTGEVRTYRSVLEALAGNGVAASEDAPAVFTDGEGYALARGYERHGAISWLDAMGDRWTFAYNLDRQRWGDGPSASAIAQQTQTNEVVVTEWEEDRLHSAAYNDLLMHRAFYDDLGLPSSLVGYGNSCSFDYDGFRLTGYQCNGRVGASYTYVDDDPLPDRIAGLDGESWTITYDSRGNIATILDPIGGETVVTRDAGGFVAAVRDPEDRQRAFSHDPAGNLTSIVLPGSLGSTHFTYARLPTCESCPRGQVDVLTGVANGLGHTWSIGVRADGLVAVVANPLAQSRVFAYDQRRLLTGVHNADGGSVTLEYDPTRVLSAVTVDGSRTSYGSDDRGHFTTADSPDLDMSWSYTGDTRMVETTVDGAVSYSVTVDYETGSGAIAGVEPSGGEASKVLAIPMLSSSMVAFAANDQPLVYNERSSQAGGRLRHHLLYDRDQNIVVGATYVYDSLGRLQTLAVDIAGGAVTDTATWSYDGSSPWSSGVSAENGSLFPSLVYAHDDAGRLVGLSGDSSITYSYDAAGRLSFASHAGSMTYDDAGRLQTTTLATYNWAADGTRATRIDQATAEEWRYTFDSTDHLTRVEKYASGQAVPYSTVSLGYDPLWRLARIDVDGAVTRLVWAHARLVAELDGSGNLVRQYWGLGLPDRVSVITEAGNDYYVIADPLGTVHRIVDASGAIVASYAYDGYGRILDASGPMAGQPRRFTGAYYIEALGLYYLRARFYDPEVGQFVSEDGALRTSVVVHPYAYADNDPTRFLDPSGLVTQAGQALTAGWDQAVSTSIDYAAGNFSPAVKAASQLADYNADPVNNSRAGTNNIMELTLLKWNPRAKKAFDDFHDFSANGLKPSTGLPEFQRKKPCK